MRTEVELTFLPGVVGICWPRRRGLVSDSPEFVSGLGWLPCTKGWWWAQWSHPLTLTGLSDWRVMNLPVQGSWHKAWLFFSCAAGVSVVPSLYKETVKG